MIPHAKVKGDYTLIFSAVVGLLVIGGILAMILKYSESFSQMSQSVAQNPIQKQAVDLAQLAEKYNAESARIISAFLSAEPASGDKSALAKKAQQDLLALTLPAEYRQRHLSEVLILGEISDFAQSGQTAKVAEKVSELRRVSESK